MFSDQYAYAIGGVFFLIFWFFLYFLRKDLRKEILAISLIFSMLGLSGHIFYGTYWEPNHIIKFPGLNAGLEDIIYTFSVAGYAAVAYEFFFFKKLKKDKKKDRVLDRKIEVILAFVVGFVVMLFFEHFSELNPIITSSYGLVTVGLVLSYFRPNRLVPMLLGGLATGLYVSIVELTISQFIPNLFDRWIEDQLLGIFIYNMPIEEFIFHFAWGVAIGYIYELIQGLRDA